MNLLKIYKINLIFNYSPFILKRFFTLGTLNNKNYVKTRNVNSGQPCINFSSQKWADLCADEDDSVPDQDEDAENGGYDDKGQFPYTEEATHYKKKSYGY